MRVNADLLELTGLHVVRAGPPAVDTLVKTANACSGDAATSTDVRTMVTSTDCAVITPRHRPALRPDTYAGLVGAATRGAAALSPECPSGSCVCLRPAGPPPTPEVPVIYRDSTAEVEAVVAYGHGRSSKGYDPCEQTESEPESGHLCEDPLRPTNHAATSDVVGRLVPRADQAAVLIDVAAGEVRTEVAATARHRKIPTIDVTDCVATHTHHLAGWDVSGRANSLLCIHDTVSVHLRYRCPVLTRP